MSIDPYILSFSALTVIATIWMGFWSARKSKTASDFFVAGRSVSVGWNASAISGEYLSAASFMGVAGMVMSSGYDALWYPVCYACGYLFLLLFIAGPLRRFGAYTIPDFAEGRFDSPMFRKIAVVFVLFIGFFYTMPQMKGAGTTLAYIFPGLPYWAGVVLVGAVITLNVALGGMKGITLVQAFQYWAKMFAISVPIFVLMAVYGHYGRQLEATRQSATSSVRIPPFNSYPHSPNGHESRRPTQLFGRMRYAIGLNPDGLTMRAGEELDSALDSYAEISGQVVLGAVELPRLATVSLRIPLMSRRSVVKKFEEFLGTNDIAVIPLGRIKEKPTVILAPVALREKYGLIATALTAQHHSVAAMLAGESFRRALPEKAPKDELWLNPFGPLTTKAAKAAKIEGDKSKPYALLYTYSLIIALVCGTAGLPHILVRFYTNPDGVAAKRTTMWVMILIGVFYLFPPVFGVMGRNLLPELYAASGAKGTDKIVLELPRILNPMENTKSSILNAQSTDNSSSIENRVSAIEHRKGIPWGSILSGITCAGAFAAFMSTFSGLLVSMTGAMAHDVYGRILRPRATPQQRLRAFKIAAVGIGGVAILLGAQVEQLQINFMVGQAFAIAAASYFPLLFMSCWWRGMTMKGAATGMLAGGLCALAAVTLTNFSDLKWIDLASFWAAHPLARILCEQPAIWTVPLAIGLMVIVSKITRHQVPDDIRMKMLVLHAPEQLGLKQEYIQEHQVH